MFNFLIVFPQCCIWNSWFFLNLLLFVYSRQAFLKCFFLLSKINFANLKVKQSGWEKLVVSLLLLRNIDAYVLFLGFVSWCVWVCVYKCEFSTCCFWPFCVFPLFEETLLKLKLGWLDAADRPLILTKWIINLPVKWMQVNFLWGQYHEKNYYF